MGMGRTLRVSILGLKVTDARKYHLSFQVLMPGQPPAAVAALNDRTLDAIRPDQVARTETSALSVNPEFLNKVFVLRLPEPLGNSLTPRVLLHINLFAMPSIDSTSAGAIIAGKEVDELMGAATLQIRGDVAARLLRGERCTLPIVLGTGAASTHSQAMATSMDLMTTSYMLGTRAAKEVLLELSLLDAEITLPRDAYALKAAYGEGKTTGKGRVPGSMSLERGSVECKLLVMVSRAENLPTVLNADKHEVPPNTFVAVKSSRDIKNNVAPQAITRVITDSLNPVWGQLLQVRYLEDELADEQLHFAIMNDDNSLLMLKAAIPLSFLLPRVHYNLKLTMPGGPLGSSVGLYVSVCLTDCPRHEARHIKALANSGVHQVLEARLAASSHPLSTFMQPASQAAQEVVAVWRLNQGGAATPAAPLKCDALYTSLDTTSKERCAATLQALSDSFDAASQQSGFIMDVLPLHMAGEGKAVQDDALVWPPDHTAMILGKVPAGTGVQLELHLLTAGREDTEPVAYASIAPQQLAGAQGVAPSMVDSTLVSTTEPGARDVTCSLEMCVWDARAYTEHVQKLSRAMQDEDADFGAGQSSMMGGNEALSRYSWQDAAATGTGSGASATIMETLVDDLILKQLAVERIVRRADTLEAQSEIIGWRFRDAEQRNKTLAEDNQNLRKIVHEEKEQSRVPAVLENSANLSRDELIERTEAALAAYGRERRRNAELVHRLQQMHAEQVDVLELKKRHMELQSAHMEMTKSLADGEGRTGKLAQYRATVKTQEEVIHNLERLLAQAVSKSKHAAGANAQVDGLRRENDALRRELMDTKGEVDTFRTELTRAQSAVTERRPTDSATREVRRDLTSRHDDMQRELEAKQEELARHQYELANVQDAVQENVSLKVKLQQAEDRAGAARDELIQAIKRYAAEIADLKWKLAEKDAQLMGGFGSPNRLRDIEDDLGIPLVNVTSYGTDSPHAGQLTPSRSFNTQNGAGQRAPRTSSADAANQQRPSNGSQRMVASAGADGGPHLPPVVRQGSNRSQNTGVSTPSQHANAQQAWPARKQAPVEETSEDGSSYYSGSSTATTPKAANAHSHHQKGPGSVGSRLSAQQSHTPPQQSPQHQQRSSNNRQ